MKKVYIVRNYNDAFGEFKEKAFSSHIKALKYIEAMCGEITTIKIINPGFASQPSFLYRQCYTTVEWSQLLLNKTNLANKYFIHHNANYHIRVMEIN